MTMTDIPKERRDVLRERVEREIRECENDRGLVTSALNLKDGELRALLDMADERDWLRVLLYDADAVAKYRGDIYGLCDDCDSYGHPYQSQAMADALTDEINGSQS